jgi:hypothetical protein
MHALENVLGTKMLFSFFRDAASQLQHKIQSTMPVMALLKCTN